jgi:hypothetical protein
MERRFAPALIVVGAVLLAALLAGQESGTAWKLSRGSSADMVHFTIERWSRGSHSSTGNDVPLSRFRGFSTSVFDIGGKTRFEYVQDAGRLVCEGSFTFGRGSGTFTFVPDPNYSAELRRLGYMEPDSDQLFTMMMVGVDLDFARAVRNSGLNASTNQLIELRIHGVTVDYIRDMEAAGYRGLSVQNYVDLRIHGVTPEFVRDLKAAGYDLAAQQVIELRIHGVDTGFLRSLKTYGLQPRASELVELRIHGVTPEYLKGLKDAGYGDLSADKITQLRIHGVSTDFIHDTKDLGYSFTAQELVDLRIHGVDGAYLRRLRDSGLKNLNADQIQRLRIHGVD